MTPNRSLFRASALTGVAVFLVSLAQVSPAAAQTTTPHANSCIVQLSAGVQNGDCTMAVPAGKRFVIESATVGGSTSSSQYIRLQVYTRVNGVTVGHFVPTAFYNPNHNYPFMTAALPGKIVAEGPNVRLYFSRGASTSNSARMYLVVSGYLEDM